MYYYSVQLSYNNNTYFYYYFKVPLWDLCYDPKENKSATW